MSATLQLQPMQTDDHAALVELWGRAGWVCVRETDTPEALDLFLRRNPTSNFVVRDGGRIVGAVMAGHDGWRGYLYHMAVAPDYRGQGIGRRLVDAAVAALREEGMPKVHCLVMRENEAARHFWAACGFDARNELIDYSR